MEDNFVNIDVQDEWGGIDEKIKPLVSTLNRLGIPTVGSCEGHIDHGYPSPWVAMRPLNPFREKINDLLEEFYKNRAVTSNAKIRIVDGHDGFWIHSMDETFIEWREMVNDRAAKRSAGENLKDILINQSEQKERARLLPDLQKEFAAFTDFLSAKTD